MNSRYPRVLVHPAGLQKRTSTGAALPARVVAMLVPNQVRDLAIRLREELQLGIDNYLEELAFGQP
jgi:hypothetical protein